MISTSNGGKLQILLENMGRCVTNLGLVFAPYVFDGVIYIG